MPTQDTRGNNPPPNVTVRQRARNYWWPQGNSVGRNLLHVAGRVIQSGFNPVAGAIQTGVHVGRGEAVEGIQRVARERGWDLNPLDNIRDSFRRRRDESPATPATREPTFMRERPRPPAPRPAAGPPANPHNAADYGPSENPDPRYTHTPGDMGPVRTPNARGLPLPANPGPPPAVGANRYNGTIARDGAAENFARGIGHANSGLGASSWGRDRMNMQQREG
jgi:hypothetical protein